MKVGGQVGFTEAVQEDTESMVPAEPGGAFVAASNDHVLPFRQGISVNVPVYSDEHVRVLSDERLDPTAGAALARRIEAAYRYDERVQQWKDDRRLDAPLTVAVLSAEAFARFTGDRSGSIGGVTTGPDLFVVPDRVLNGKTAMDEQVIAHELSHIQDFRQGGAAVTKVPIYLQEGKAYLLGETYPRSEHLANPHIQYVGKALGQISGEDAANVMKHFRTGEDEARSGAFGFIGETAGALFIEFMRVQMGEKHALQKVAEVVSDVGHGSTYEAAFQRQFETTPRKVEAAFVDFVTQTEGDPRERLKGTLFAV
jgi:hypothetical protein